MVHPTAVLAALVLASVVLVDTAAPSLAAGSARGNIDVSSRVSANCVMTTANLDFGNYDPLADQPKTGQTTVTVRCTKGSAAIITAGAGLYDSTVSVPNTNHAMKNTAGASGRNLDYLLCGDSGCTTSWTGGPVQGSYGSTTVTDHYITRECYSFGCSVISNDVTRTVPGSTRAKR